MIQGHGPSNPKGILIAGFAHGEDLTSNYALTGYKEHALKELCSKAGLKLADFYRTCYIKNDAKFNEDIEGEELAKLSEPYKKILIDEINDLKTNLLIPLDELAFNFVADLHGIRKFRGSILPCNQELGFNRPLKVLPILGPYPYLQKEFPLKWISEIDFQKIPKHWEDAKIPDQFTNCWVARNPGSLREFLNRSYNEDGILNFDIETYLGIPTCISLCFDGQESVCVPLFDEDIDADSSTLMWMSVAKLLNSPIKKVNQNIKYDWKIEERWGFKVNNIYGDPQIASSLILPELKRNLGFLTSLYTDLPYFKDEGKEWNPKKYNKDRFYMYNAKDSLASWKIHKEQEKELEELGCTQLYRNLIQSLIVYKTMENVGIRVDDEARRGFLEKYESLYRIETMKLAELSGRPLLNPLSSVIAKNVLFEDCGFDPRQKGINGKTGEDQIKLLLAYGNAKNSPIHGPIIAQGYLNCRKIHKVIELLSRPLYPDGKFRGEYNLGGTDTGRTSCSGSLDQLLVIEEGKVVSEDLGHSLQTIAKHGFVIDGFYYGTEIRRMFVPERGFVFLEMDGSGAEARVDTILAGNFGLLEVFDSKTGIHRLTGSWIYDCQPEEIKKNVFVDGVERYYTSKQVRHAAERNIGAGGLYALIQQPLKECVRLLAKIHAYQPEIKKVFHREVEQAIKTTRQLRAPNGRARFFLDRFDQQTINAGISFLPQAIISDQTKQSLTVTYNENKDICLPIVEAHDGSLFMVKEGSERKVYEDYKRNYMQPIDFNNCTLKRDFKLSVPIEAEISKENWYDMRGYNG